MEKDDVARARRNQTLPPRTGADIGELGIWAACAPHRIEELTGNVSPSWLKDGGLAISHHGGSFTFRGCKIEGILTLSRYSSDLTIRNVKEGSKGRKEKIRDSGDEVFTESIPDGMVCIPTEEEVFRFFFEGFGRHGETLIEIERFHPLKVIHINGPITRPELLENHVLSDKYVL